MSTSPTKPLRADAARNRARVLEAARQCFAEHGVEAQMDDIAGAAGVGVGTVYRHFSTKEALLEAIASEYFDAQCDAARAALEVEDPWQAFAGYIRSGAAVMAQSRGLAQVIADRSGIMLSAAQAADARHGLFGMLEQLIERAQRAGALRGDFQLEDVPLVMCSIGTLQDTPKAVGWKRLLEIIIDGLRAPGTGSLPAHVDHLPRVR
jgi:AcrR family transcriptional regulator